MERIALKEAAFRSFHILFCLFINLGDTLNNGGDVLTKHVAISNTLWLEEAAAQDFCDILFEHWLHGLFT